MEKNEISIHEIKIYEVLKKSSEKWLSNKEIADLAGKMSDRTVRSHTLKFCKLGIIDHAEVFPAHRYRWSDKAEKRNASYCLRLQNCAKIFGISI